VVVLLCQLVRVVGTNVGGLRSLKKGPDKVVGGHAGAASGRSECSMGQSGGSKHTR